MFLPGWDEWNPGLNNDHLTIGEVLDTLPGNPPGDISFLVRLFENPKSPIAFRGAISLPRHDCLHVLLGRGLLPQDEAFVIGYTMGTVPGITSLETWLFKLVCRHLYQEPYTLCADDVIAYDLGVEAGKAASGKKVYEFPFEDNKAVPLGKLRAQLGVNSAALRFVYARERASIASKASNRLPI